MFLTNFIFVVLLLKIAQLFIYTNRADKNFSSNISYNNVIITMSCIVRYSEFWHI